MPSDSSHTALGSIVVVHQSCYEPYVDMKLRSVTLRDGRVLFCDRVGWGDRVIVQDSRTFLVTGWFEIL
jgi:hypothetical protein